MVNSKKGSEKYYIIISLILGLMVLGIGLYFIFNEYFEGEDVDWQMCRQSIILRANAPEVEKGGFTLASFKDSFPLKCRTKVVEVGEGDLKEIKDIIGRTMAECWALYDNGDVSAFPTKAIGADSVCVPCARIHLTEESKKKLGSKTIDIRKALDERMSESYSYFTYLNNSGKKFSAFDIASGMSFNLDGEAFGIDETGVGDILEELGMRLIGDGESEFTVSVKNKLNGASAEFWKGGDVSLPKIFNPNKGDLMVVYGLTSFSGYREFGNYVPYLFYFQTGGDLKPFQEVNKSVFGATGFCETWEGIPA